MVEPKQDETFKVVDRRLFTEDGQLRKDVLEQERRDEEAARKAANKAPSPGASGADARAQGSTKAPAGGADGSSQPNAPSRGFQMLVDFLARNAAAMLGGMADPRTGQAFLDLDGAREMIDMLDALRESTRGNLAQADEDLLIEVIGSLKLTYMEVSKAATDAMAKKAKQKG
ncbi:MAG TPA: DUF1844 domain-containing protein [Candidatus Acidoferrales bacterium]|nr:DUF1844 domain-containing protein [Candidatus Acidoferrales bacterium]